MSSEFGTPIDIRSATDILRKTQKDNSKATNANRLDMANDATSRLAVLEGNLCPDCQNLQLFMWKDRNQKNISVKCTAGRFPLSIHRLSESTGQQPECSLKIPLNGE